MKNILIRVSAGVFVGLLVVIAIVWLLSKTLGNVPHTEVYAGNTIYYWQQQLYSGNAGTSNAASAVVSARLVPQFVDTMFHDTNDSPVRLSLVNLLNGLPGVQIQYDTADMRRARAARCLGELGPAAKSALPDLITALKGNDTAIRLEAILALGAIRSEPDTVIPVLIPFLADNNLNEAAATALAEFGGLAKPAVPKLLPLLHAFDKDDVFAAQQALLKIDPEAAAAAGVKTNRLN